MKRQICRGASNLEEEIAGRAGPFVIGGGVDGEIERVEGDGDGLGCAGSDGDALPAGEFTEGLASMGREGDVDLGNLVAVLYPRVAEIEGHGLCVGVDLQVRVDEAGVGEGEAEGEEEL